jgi:hypothetical protein
VSVRTTGEEMEHGVCCCCCEKRKKTSPIKRKQIHIVESEFSLPKVSVFQRIWDTIGILLVICQLASHFLRLDATKRLDRFSFISAFKRSVSTNGGSDGIIGFLNIHILVDAYFLIDVFIRMNKSRGQPGQGSLRPCWFIIDLLLVFPHGFCWQLWQSRPALKLLNIREGKRPIFEFFRNREFRKNVFQLIREHKAERKLYVGFKGLFLGGGNILVAGGTRAVAVSRFKGILARSTSIVRKTGKILFPPVVRTWRRYRSLKVYSSVVRGISWFALSLRAAYMSRVSKSDDDAYSQTDETASMTDMSSSASDISDDTID